MWARAPPLAFERFFSLGYTLKQVVWFGLVYMPNSNSALFVQPYSLWNDAITGYNACVCKNCFTARRHALARSLLSAGVRLSVTFVYYIVMVIKHLSRPGSPAILVFDPQALIPNSRRTTSSGVQNTVCDFGLKSPFISDTVGDRPVYSCHGTLTGSHR